MSCLNAAEVAKKLRHSRSWFYDHREELEKKGFPPQIEGTNRWPERGIDVWIEAGGKMVQAARAHKAREAMDRAFGVKR